MKEQTMTVFLFIFSVDTAQCSFYLHSYHSIVADWVGPIQGFLAAQLYECNRETKSVVDESGFS